MYETSLVLSTPTHQLQTRSNPTLSLLLHIYKPRTNVPELFVSRIIRWRMKTFRDTRYSKENMTGRPSTVGVDLFG